jgi:hypothetical protein
MSVNFYNNRAWMVGVDLHDYYVPGPGPGIPVPWGYVVFAPMWWPPATFWKRTGTVTADGWKMIQGGFQLRLVPHIPALPPPPHPLSQAINLALIILLSKSTATMTVHSVTGEGKALATCVYGAFGLNANCGKQLVGPVIDPSTVRTSPSLGDYASAVAAFALGKVINVPIPIVGGLLKKFIIKPIREWVQEQVDELV